MPDEIKIRYNAREGTAVVYRRVHYDHKAISKEVLAQNGKWREKQEYEVIFDDEKITVEVI